MAAGRPTLNVVVISGVSGAGKSTVGRLLADRLGWVFCEGDDLHPRANVEKMAAGLPLTDADRAPWLDSVRAWIDGQLDAGHSGVITCSALKRSYRERLRRGAVRIALLTAPPQILERRLSARAGHYMPASLLGTQLADLEAPTPDEDVLEVPGGLTPDQAAGWIAAQIGADASSHDTKPVNPLSPNASVAEPPAP